MLIDSHCHLDFDELNADLDGVLSRADYWEPIITRPERPELVLDPDELTKEAGRRVRVTLPAGVPGGADV